MFDGGVDYVAGCNDEVFTTDIYHIGEGEEFRYCPFCGKQIRLHEELRRIDD